MLEANAMVDLHRHLDGSMRMSTLKSLAGEQGLVVPNDIRFHTGMGLHAALAKFGFTLSCLQTLDAVQRVANEMCEDAIEEGLSYLEIRFAPQLHGPIQDVVEAALSGISGRAGLILCGLYGEPPMVLDELVRVGVQYPGVVGLDLAGCPLPSHSWSMRDYAPVFQRAGEMGLGRTVHAGEARPPEEIATAILELGAHRIGHGSTLLENDAVLALVLARDVVIEACPTSNVQTGIFDSVADHPLVKWMDLGVRVTVCTDNTFLSSVTLPEEMRRVQAIPGMNEEKLRRLVVTGQAAVFT